MSYLEERRSQTKQRLEAFSADLTAAETLAGGRACVYLTGSFARGESGTHSDLDLFIVGKVDKSEGDKKTEGRRALRHLDEICIKADLIETTRKHQIPDFSGDGEYLVHYTVDELIKTLGSPLDDASNTFTARLLLILESKPLLGETVYDDTIQKAIAAYWDEFEDHKADFVPGFLANDILRLWRTFCVNYEARTAKDPLEKKAKRKLKNYKLKHSRLLTCYSALCYFLSVFAASSTVSPSDALHMVRLTPTQRLEHISTLPGTHEQARKKIAELLHSYEEFLANTDAPESTLIDRFMQPDTARTYFAAANQFGDTMYALLGSLGQDSRLHRLITV